MRFLHLLTLSLALVMLAGCEQKKPESVAPESEKVSLFKEGKGILFSEETKKLFGVEMAEVSEKPVQRRFQKTAQVYRAGSESIPASAMLLFSGEEAKELRVSEPVKLQAGDAPEISGTLVRLDTQVHSVLGQVEALVEFADPQQRYPAGAFVTATFTNGEAKTVLVVPESSLLTTADGSYVYRGKSPLRNRCADAGASARENRDLVTFGRGGKLRPGPAGANTQPSDSPGGGAVMSKRDIAQELDNCRHLARRRYSYVAFPIQHQNFVDSHEVRHVVSGTSANPDVWLSDARRQSLGLSEPSACIANGWGGAGERQQYSLGKWATRATAAVFINDAESGLLHDFDVWLEKLAPHEPTSQYHHNRTGEDNADAHLKRQVMGREVVVAVTNGSLDLGPWEQIYYGEFDGRRRKRVLVKIIGE